ncbi:hypothetical protein ABT024_07100 [Streptomyces sp. NPDC002812]|uniref:hypothetical protein n=1 Tax=Streptomyces sp. NPDC002812 TaxID=3154434 RepID=UPI0033290F6B
MTIDAMHWVWTRARATGNPRLVLLAVADKVRDAQCITRMGTTELRSRLGGVSKSVVVRAVDKALESGELVMVEEARGSRAATYRLAHAVGYVRPAPGATGPESGPLNESYRSRIGTPSDTEGSQIETPSSDATGPESGPGGYRIETPCGPESVPLYQTTPTRSESKQAQQPAPPLTEPIPVNCRPLVDALTNSGVLVRWNLSTAEWFTVEALILRSGIPVLTAHAQQQASRREITYARYFLAGWRDCPPLPETPAGPRPLRTVPNQTPATGWRPYTNPTDPSVYENGFGR